MPKMLMPAKVSRNGSLPSPITNFPNVKKPTAPQCDDVGNRVVVTHNPATVGEAIIKHAKQPLRLIHIALLSARVIDETGIEAVEPPDLAEDPSDVGHLKHQPLDRLMTESRYLRQEAPRFLGEIEQNGAGLPQGERQAIWAVRIDDHRKLAVGIQSNEFSAANIPSHDVHAMSFVGEASFFEHDGHLHAIWRWRAEQLKLVRVPQHPAAINGAIFEPDNCVGAGHFGRSRCEDS